MSDDADDPEEHHYGGSRRATPFALGEIRRVRSEKIRFVEPLVNGELPEKAPVSPDFLPKMEARCQGLLDAQAAYADAMRATDPHWIAMSGYRVGEMYQKLHQDLMSIPPTLLAKTGKQKQIFFAIMHVRYRVLLEKGLEMTKRTIALGENRLDSSAWIRRAEEMKRGIERAIEEEKTALQAFPFTEQEIEGALEILKQKRRRTASPKRRKRRRELENNAPNVTGSVQDREASLDTRRTPRYPCAPSEPSLAPVLLAGPALLSYLAPPNPSGIGAPGSLT